MSRKKRHSICFILLFSLLWAGCEKKEEITLESVTLDKTEEQSSQQTEVDPVVTDDTEAQEPASTEMGGVWVYVCGAVNLPGVYELESGSRIYQAINMAGGLTPEAATAYVNQAEPVEDGQRIYIPKEEEVSTAEIMQGVDSQGSTGEGAEENAIQQSEGKVNINSADLAGLQTLPGIGEVKASAIIAYREANGGFSSAEEIMQVEGIKEGTFRKIQDMICVQ